MDQSTPMSSVKLRICLFPFSLNYDATMHSLTASGCSSWYTEYQLVTTVVRKSFATALNDS